MGMEFSLELKKHVGAVHIKGQLTLLQRKISNVLLLNAYDELPAAGVTEHHIRLGALAANAGFDSNDYQLLKEALEALVDLKIRWNILDEKNRLEWGISSFLAQAVIRDGVCRYAYPPALRKRLHNPEVYARINLLVQEKFTSSYALALYENTVRFRKVGTTGWVTLEHWRDLLGVGDGQHVEFKYLNRDVLKPAIAEVNERSDILLEMKLMREKRRVVAMKFTVTDKLDEAKASASSGEDSDASEEVLAEALVRLGCSVAQISEVLRSFEPEHILRNIAYVRRYVQQGKPIRNLAGYVVSAIRHDYATVREGGKPIEKPTLFSAPVDEIVEVDHAEERYARLRAYFERLPESEQARLRGLALEEMKKDDFLSAHYRSAGEQSPMVQSVLAALELDILELDTLWLERPSH